MIAYFTSGCTDGGLHSVPPMTAQEKLACGFGPAEHRLRMALAQRTTCLVCGREMSRGEHFVGKIARLSQEGVA